MIDYLKKLTFLTKEEIEKIMKEHEKEPHLRIAQKALAREFIIDLHGEEEFKKALKMSEVLFNGNVSDLSADDIEVCFKGVPNFDITEEMTLIDMLINNNICSSRREAREFLSSNAISINGSAVNDENMLVNKDIAIDGRVVVIRRGKKKYFLGIIK